jgi:1,4-alpha-glucan branching enzyme
MAGLAEHILAGEIVTALLQHVDQELRVLAYLRREAGGPRDDVLVAVNLNAEARRDVRIGVPREGRWRVRFNSDWEGYDPEFAAIPTLDAETTAEPWDGLAQSLTIGLGPYAAVILSQDD